MRAMDASRSAEPAPELAADVLVAGAGGAGLVAALRAARAGASVLVVEASERFREGCSTSMSTSMIPAAGTRWQAAAGIDDDTERFRADVLAKTGGSADPAVTEALTAVAPALVEWLADELGVPLELVADFDYPGHSRRRCHAVPDRSGRTLHGHLLAALERRERGALLAAPMRLAALRRAPGGGLEAQVAAPGGAPERLAVRAAVLATGGFAADPERVAREIPEIATALYFGGEGSRGDALALGGALGARAGYLDSYQGHGSVAVPHGVLVTWATVMHGAFLVNAQGERFGDETTGYSEYAAAVLAQPGAEAWVVIDEAVDRACRPFADWLAVLEAGALRWAPDAGGLAALLHCDPERLARTIAAAAGAAQGRARDPFGREGWERPLAPPYGAVRVTGALFHTQGGLRVDRGARVLDGAGAPIAGLFAAGGAAVGMSGHGASGYLAGNGLLGALGLGYLAGDGAAALSASTSGADAAP